MLNNNTSDQSQNLHLDNLVTRIVTDFNDRVKNETDPSNILLKGHLLIENLLQETLAIFDIHKLKNLNRLSFSEKIRYLSEIKTNNINIQEKIKETTPLLYAVNEVRNNLSHNISFSVSEYEVNRIGINLGSVFILQKYQSGHKKIKDNLFFV